MQFIQRIEEYQPLGEPIALTIGTFDGVHRGHQVVLEHVVEHAKRHAGRSVAITYRNHPASILRPEQAPPLVCTLEHRLHLLEQMGVDCVCLLTFTREFSEQSAEEFLQKVRPFIPFAKLILGVDATLGRGRHGDQKRVQELSEGLGFEVEYLPKYVVDGIHVSSSNIREFIQSGRLLELEKLLGRKYSIYSSVTTGGGKGKALGFPTANIDVTGLCLPPLGVYAVQVFCEGKSYKGVANLGIAPTVRTDRIPVLEVHLFQDVDSLYQKMMEVVFYDFIRPEMRFSDVGHLKIQISRDIQTAQTLLDDRQIGFCFSEFFNRREGDIGACEV
jgi:riboflavin kinase/FMN adenylyltransferase